MLCGMDLTFVSHFTAHPVPATSFEQYLSAWKEGVKRMSGVDVTEASRRYLASDGEYSDYAVEGVCKGNNDSDYKALGFDGTLLLAGDQVVKTNMVLHLDKEEFQGEIYVTLINFPLDKPFERRFFSLWTILNEKMFKECTPFRWTPAPAPKILLENSQRRWIVKLINLQNKSPYINTWIARQKFAHIVESTPCEIQETTIEAAVDTEVDTAPNPIDELPTAEPAAVPIADAVPVDPAAQISPTQIAKLQEQLEKYKSENEELSEKNEQLTNINRDLKKNQKTYIQNIEEQKKRLRVLKKRADSAEARAKEAARGDVKEFCEHFDQELERLETEATEKDERINQLTLDLDTANGKITSLKGRLNKQNMGNGIYGLLAAPENEGEKYENEFGIAILSALHKAIDKTPTKNNSPHTRSIDVWQAIIDANPDLEKAFEQYCNDTKALKNATVGGELDKKKHLLKPFNLDFNDHHNNHGRISFGSDDRYIASTASTASETASGFSNCAKDLRNTFLFPT